MTGIDITADAAAGKATIQIRIEAGWWELQDLPGYGVNAISASATACMAACQATVLFERAGEVNEAKPRGQVAECWGAHFQCHQIS